MTLRSLLPAAGAALVAVLLLLLQSARSERDAARREAAVQDARAASAQAATAVASAAGVAVERARAREVVLTIEAKEAADEIIKSEGAEAPVARDVLARWGAAVDRLRSEAGRARGDLDVAGAADADGGVSAAGQAGRADGG